MALVGRRTRHIAADWQNTITRVAASHGLCVYDCF
jgi:hypothetical protein